jgi:hypothetical protein
MASFRDRPNPEPMDDFPTENQTRHPIVRALGGGKKLIVIALTDRPLLYPTHWVRSRTTACLDPEPCEGCDADVETRYKLYLGIYFPTDALIGVLEITDHGGHPINEYWKKYGSVRGKKITIWRSGKKENSPVNSTVTQSLFDPTALPPSPDIREWCNRLWYSNPKKPRPEAHTSSPALPGQQTLVTADGQPITNGRIKRSLTKEN